LFRLRSLSLCSVPPLVLVLTAACAVAHRRPPSPPIAPDPGPIGSTAPLAADRFPTGPGGWARVLVDLREQVDTGELIRRYRREGAGRPETRRRTLAALRQVAQRGAEALSPFLDRLVEEGAVDYYKPLRFHNRFYVSIRPQAIARLAAQPVVARIEPEFDSVREAQRRRAGAAGRPPRRPIPPGDSWAVAALGLRALWNRGIDGRGVRVGLLDAGVLGDHAAFEGGRAPGHSWFDPVGGTPEPIDTRGHGSEVLACALARPVDGRALGAAPGAVWVAALANQFNSYNNVNMSLAADWLLFEGRPDVVLGAWGHGAGSCDRRDLPMIEAFRAAGVLPVFAAGNDGPGEATGQAPAALPGLAPDGRRPLSVAAVDERLRVIDASSRGPSPCGGDAPFPDVAAPGWDLPVPAGPDPRGLVLGAGTSMAVGWVGGAAALVLQVAPEMRVDELEDLLRATARDLPPAGIDPASGHGLIDPAAAVAAAERWLQQHARPRP